MNSIERPFLLKVPYIPREWLKIAEINRNNEMILERFNKLNNKDLEKLNQKPKHNGRDFTKKSAFFLKKIKNQHGDKMKVMKKNKKKSNESWKDEEYMNMLSGNYESNDDISEASVDPEEAYENLKKYIEELYEKQQKRNQTQ